MASPKQRTGNRRIAKVLNQLSSVECSNSKKSVFSDVSVLPPDAIFFTKQRYKEDPDPRKVNLGIGAYRDDNGKPMVLKVVRKIESEMANDMTLNHEYLSIGGDAEFVRLSQELILGKNCKQLNGGTVAGVQAISGTGSLRLIFNFVKNNCATQNNPNFKVHISDPTWGNHKKVILKAGLTYETYSYWNPQKRNLDLNGMLNDLKRKSNPGDVVLLHGCAHNPTGVDPTKEQWNIIANAMNELRLIAFFDNAYQGFATGDLDNDAYAVRLFADLGREFFIAQSFAKNLGLYNERVGCASIVCSTAEARKACDTQLRAIIRPMYSNPPAHGVRIAKRVMGNAENYKLWKQEMREMSGRIMEMRKRLRSKVEELNTEGTWNHITDQIGMFTFTGLNKKQVEVMIDKHHIYMLSNGRISMAGVASSNVEYIANAINDVVTNYK